MIRASGRDSNIGEMLSEEGVTIFLFVVSFQRRVPSCDIFWAGPKGSFSWEESDSAPLLQPGIFLRRLKRLPRGRSPKREDFVTLDQRRLKAMKAFLSCLAVCLGRPRSDRAPILTLISMKPGPSDCLNASNFASSSSMLSQEST